MMLVKKKVLILGSTGMLSSMMIDYLHSLNKFEIACTYNNNLISNFYNYGFKEFHFSAYDNVESQLSEIYKTFKPDYIINCIGIVNTYCKDNDPTGIENAVRVNSMFPYTLSKATANILPNTKIIQIATDCVYDGEKGAYTYLLYIYDIYIRDMPVLYIGRAFQLFRYDMVRLDFRLL